MVERVPNRTRSALILLLIAIIVFIVILLANCLAFSSSLFRSYDEIDRSEEDRDYYYDDEEEEEENLYYAIEPLGLSCGLNGYGLVAMYILFIVGISLLFSARYAYGDKHGRTVIASFVLSILMPVLTGFLIFIIAIFELTTFGIVPTLPIILFLTAIFLTTFNIGGRKHGLIGLLIGVLFSLPLLYLNKSHMDMDTLSELRTFCVTFLITITGLLVSMTMFLVSIKNAIGYTKAHSPRQDNLQLRLLNQQAHQLKTEIEILKLQKEQMSLLSEIKAIRAPSDDVKLIGTTEHSRKGTLSAKKAPLTKRGLKHGRKNT